MALTQNFKVNQLSKDLGIKSKEIMELLSSHGVQAKTTQSALEPDEFGLLLDKLTKKNQINGIDDYIDGITYIPSAKKEEKKPEPKKEEKAEVKAETKPETKPAPAPEKKAEEKKPEVKAEPKKEEPKKAEKPVEKKPEVKPEPKKEEKAEVKAETKPAPAPEKKAEEKKPEVKAEPKPAQKTEEKRTVAPEKRTAGDNTPAKRPAEAERPQQRSERPQQNDRFQRNDRPQQSDRPQQNDRFAKREGDRPAQNDRFQKNDRPQQNDRFSRPQSDRPQNDRFQRNDRPQNDRFGGGFGGGFRDKDEINVRVPREKFQPQPIVRAQTPKGGDQNPKQRGATRVVDTRAGNVDLSKYDERLDNFVPDSVKDARGGNQKVKKQQGRDQQQNNRNNKNNNQKKAAPVVKQTLHVTIPEEITVRDLAMKLKVTAGEVVKRLMLMGLMVNVNQSIDFDTAYLIADELGAEVEKEVVVTIEEKLFDEAEDSADTLVERAPVICVMGHVDHGKTSLLDAIRHTNVTSGEAGGITQHIGAYRVRVNDKELTFLDTPGHEAFTAMRARGAQATDIAILVVAADDGIMPQTIEAINHAKAAGIDIIVAINKMDKPTANPDAIKQELTKYDLVPEEWGGDVMCVPVSALTRMGINDLLENVLLIAEVKELKANPNRRAKGIVIEAKLDKGRGPVATVLVQNGTLKNGDIVIAGTAVGRVRAMTDYKGTRLKEAGPSVPVEIIGLAEVPLAGDEFNAVEDERMARDLADQRREKAKEAEFKANARASLNDLFNQISEGIKDLNVIVKADVGGSAEAVKSSLEKLSNEEVKVKVIHSAAGGITEGDVMLASASNAIVVGFNVRPDKGALDSAERQGVEIRTYRVIYDCIEEIKAAMKGMLAPKFTEQLNGHAEVRQVIHVPNVGFIAGSYVLDGKIGRNNQIRVVRDGIVVFEDKISSLRRFKDDVREVASGYECGIGLDRFNDMKPGDILEAFVMVEVER